MPRHVDEQLKNFLVLWRLTCGPNYRIKNEHNRVNLLLIAAHRALVYL